MFTGMKRIVVWLWSKSQSVNFIQKILKKLRNQKISELFGKDVRDRTAIPVHAIVPEGETQRYKVRKNSIYQTKSELL